MRDIIVSTVGTSLLGNLNRSENAELQNLAKARNAKGLSVALTSLDPSHRMLGAEINSIHSILASGRVKERERLLFLVSDTDEGRFTGEVLQHYYQTPANVWRFPQAESRVVEGLNDLDIKKFKNQGLRNLVRLIATDVQKFGPERLLINATGGYKAQISFAGIIGQALGIPVCYLFERFAEVIELPPQPVSLDMDFWLGHSGLFYELEAGRLSDREDLPGDERFAGLVESLEQDGQYLACLSATGQLFHDTFRLRFQQQREKMLPPDSGLDSAAKDLKFEDNNKGKHPGLRHYLEKVARVPYVKRIYTYYYHPALSKPNLFRKSAKGEVSQVEGWFSNAGAYTIFDVVTTATDDPGQAACIADLNERFAG